MSDDPWLRLREGPCRSLRSKEMFYDNGIPWEERGSSGIYWCSHTHKCLGPDGTVVSNEDCRPDRSCYEPIIQIGTSDAPAV
jgi:hypothetical protein